MTFLSREVFCDFPLVVQHLKETRRKLWEIYELSVAMVERVPERYGEDASLVFMKNNLAQLDRAIELLLSVKTKEHKMTPIPAHGDLEFASEVEKNSYYDELEHEAVTVARRLTHLLSIIPAPEGIYTFPDGETYPAGLRLRVRSSPAGKECDALLPNGRLCGQMTCDHGWTDPREEELERRVAKAGSTAGFFTDMQAYEERERKFKTHRKELGDDRHIGFLIDGLHQAGWNVPSAWVPNHAETNKTDCAWVIIDTKPEHLYQEIRRLQVFLRNRGCVIKSTKIPSSIVGDEVVVTGTINVAEDLGRIAVTFAPGHKALLPPSRRHKESAHGTTNPD